MLLATNAFIYFKEYEEDKQLLTYPSEKLVETVGASISLLESKMAKVAHMGSVEEKMTVAIKETSRFWMDWVIWLFAAQPENSRWYCERCHKNCYSMVVQAKNRSLNEAEAEAYKEEADNPVPQVSQ